MPNPFVEVINRCLPEPQSSLLAGILFGIKTQLPRNLYQALIDTGTIHIVALSGQNISILTRVLAQITLVFGRRTSSLLTIVGIVFFVVFVGGEPTIIRAAIMGSLSLFAVYFGRQAWSLLSLILAAGIMLIINPSWIANLSFQLSFLATLGIILFGQIPSLKPKNIWQEINREIQINLRTTLAAQILTVPLIIYIFKRMSIIAPLSNVLVGWLIAPIMVLGLILSFAGWIWLPLGKLIGWIIWVPLTYLIKVVYLTASLPWASINF